MNLKITSFLFLLTTVCFFSCTDKNSHIPSIEFVGVSKSYMVQNGVDSMYLKFKFTDGNGDIGSDTTDNIFVKDSRTGAVISTYKIPDYLGGNANNSSRSGEITIIVYSQCCIYPDSSSCHNNHPSITERKMYYDIQIVDNAGNYSNVIQSSEISLECI